MDGKSKQLNNYKIEDFISDDSFINFATDKNQHDIAKWKKWLLGEPKNKQIAINAKLLICNLRFTKQEVSSDFITSEWNKLRVRLNLNIPEQKKNKRNIFKRKIWQYAAAASFLLLFASAIYYYSSAPRNTEIVNYKEVIVPKGEIKKILLPDGTTIAINSDSKLKYDQNFSGEYREVFLQGEAWFDVKHNSKKPFVVHTHENDITVLGTAFNICAYPDENIFKTTLERGKITVSHNNEKAVELGVNQTYIFIKDINKQEIVETNNIETYSAWKDGVLVFQNQKFDCILRKLERSHNVIFNIKNTEVENCKYTGTFSAKADIVSILDIMKLPTHFKYEILADTIIVK